MVENKEYSPTLIEWDELVLLWSRSKTMFASTLATNVKARIAWTTKSFIEKHPDASYRAVYAWLEHNLEIASGSAPVSERLPAIRQHDEITAVHRTPRRTPHGRVTTTEGEPADASDT
jgi:hypothetical protein